MTHLLAVLGLGLACGAWILVQRWVAARDPEQPGVEGGGRCHDPGDCGACAEVGCGDRR